MENVPLHQGAQGAPKRPRPSLKIAVVATALLVVCALATILTATRQTLATNRDELQVQQLCGEIDRLEEVLTMSTWMAATTGEDKWRRRYDDHVGQLAGAIEMLRQVSPMIFDREFGTESDAASRRLVVADGQLHACIRGGDLAAAQAILSGDDYLADKQAYVSASERAKAALTEFVARATSATHAYAAGLIFLTILLCVVAAIEWSRIFRAQHAMQVAAHLEQVRAERADAEALSNAKSQVVANVSHELRTPLTAILGYADLLADPDYPDGERLAAVGTIQRHGHHLLQVINDLLDISKIEFGAMEVNPCSVDPAALVTDALALLRLRADEKGVELERSFATSVPRSIQTDPVRVRQILINLIGNAVKFTAVGEVRVTVWFELLVDQPQLLISVRDTGIGMDAEQIQRLFLPFEQGDATTERRFGGTGIGLAIAKHYAQLLGGDITVDSEVGQGSTFTFTMPIVRTDDHGLWHPDGASANGDGGEGDAAPGESNAAVDLSGVTILVAEDGADNQRLLSYFLCRAGADVLIADNGQQALEMVAEDGSSISLILMDMQMPVIDGYQATKVLRRQGFTKPIIALTANAMSTDREDCLAVGCIDFMTKPVDRRELLSICARWSHLQPAQVAGPQLET